MDFLRSAWRHGLPIAAAFLFASPAAASDPLPPMLPSVTFRGASYCIREVDPKKEDLELFLKDDQGNYLRDFAGLEKYVASKGEKLLFAANAGMYQLDLRPVGLLVQDGSETAPINLRDGTGNFCMKPNGVFLINDKHEARVVDSVDYATQLNPAVWATQSGPLLLHGGSIHPEFNADSQNLKIRSGVGVRKDGVAVFALSRTPVNFYNFASLFLEKLKCPNALFLDGEISAFDVPGVKDPMPHTFGPMIGVVSRNDATTQH
jgi:uncharacterized protein YigE (DUF2233 family)